MRKSNAPAAAPTEEPRQKELRFVGASRKDMRSMPEEVADGFGHDLWLVQIGEMPESASPFEGAVSSNLMKLTERHDGNTFRCVYAAKFEKVVYVLHVFQKKSKSGIATPQTDIDLARSRYQTAKADYEAEFGQEERK